MKPVLPTGVSLNSVRTSRGDLKPGNPLSLRVNAKPSIKLCKRRLRAADSEQHGNRWRYGSAIQPVRLQVLRQERRKGNGECESRGALAKNDERPTSEAL
jgi:hypothetical protein